MPRKYWVGIASLLLSGPWVAITPAHAARPRIAVLAVAADQLGVDVRAKLDAALAGGLAASGAEVVDSTTTGKRIDDKGLAGCETSTCRVAIAEAAGARYLLRGSVESMGRSYVVRLEMIDGITGSVVGMREDRCEICTETDVYETASVSASALKAQVWKDAGKNAGPGPSTGGIGRAADTTGGGSSLITSPSPDRPAEGAGATPRLRTLSWVGIGAGVVAIGAGAFLVTINADGSCGNDDGVMCPRNYRTRTGGFTLIGVGALAAVLGTTLLIGRF